MKITRATITSIFLLCLSVFALEAQEIGITGITSTPVSCYGYSDGTITVNVTGGSGSYNYLLLRETSLVESAGPLTDVSYTFTSLEAYGPYFIFVVDEASSEGDSAYDVGVKFVTGPGPIRITSAITTDISCNNANDGNITVTAKGESGNHIFDLSGPKTETRADGNFENLPEGTYLVTVTDAICPSSDARSPLTITNPPVLSVSVDPVTNVKCFGEQTGSITITPSGGTPAGTGTGYTYNWTGPGFSSTSEDISNIGAGDYFVTVADRNSCTVGAGPITVSEPTQIIMAVDSIADVSCNGSSDGAINVTVSGGTPGYTFQWTGPGGVIASTEDISGLSSGSYQLTVRDASVCEEVMPVVTVSGGSPPFSFAWSGPDGYSTSSQNISGLEAGGYSVTITDLNGCTTDLSGIAINEPEEITVAATGSDITCNGENDGTISITVSGGTPAYLYSWTGPSYSSSEKDISGLGPGIYNLDVEDGNGCPASFPGLDTIVEPGPISALFMHRDNPTCNGGNDGSIQIDVSGGTLPMTFDWTDSDGNTVSTEEDPSGLEAGRYSLTITDINGCTFTAINFATLNNPLPVVSVLTVTPVTCFGESDGSITVTSSGGTAPYEYSITGDNDGSYQTDPVFDTLSAGPYTVWTRDMYLCVTSNDITVLQPDSMVIAAATVSGSILCNGDSTGQISFGEITGGTAPYFYSINGGADYYSSGDFINLPAGDYQTMVSDAVGCTRPGELLQITQPPLFGIGDLQLFDVTSCADAEEGRILAVPAGGSGTVTFTLNGTETNTTGDFTGLSAGSYVLTLTDGNGCSIDTAVEILAPPAITITSLTITNVTGCNGDSNGKVRVTAAGGTPPLRYSLDGVNFIGSGNFNALEAGDYTLTIRDGNGCILDSAIALTQPAPITLLSTSVTQVTCTGASDGIIEIVAAGGTSPFEYTLIPDGTTSDNGIFTGLDPDIYTALVTDSEGCPPVSSPGIRVTEPPPLVVDSVVETDITCNGAGDGTISIYGSGGTPPYEYSVDNKETWSADSLVSGLAPGAYEIFLRDSNLCVSSGGQVNLSEPPALTLTVTTTDVTSCAYDSTGSIEASGGGGTGFLFYSLDGVNFQDSGTFTNLPAGMYTVTLMDETGCVISAGASISAPMPVNAVISKTDATMGNLGSITISGATGGYPPYEYSIGGPAGPFTTDTVYAGLEAGLYPVVVRDQNGCTYEEMVEIVDILPLEVILNATDVSCFGADDGSVEMIPQNATGRVEYSIDSGLNFVQEALFENLPGNTTYYLAARDVEGKLFTGSVSLSEPSQIQFFGNVMPAECNAFSETGAISISVSGGTAGYTFLWSDGDTGEDRSNIVAGTYILATSDSNGCSRTDTFNVGSLITVVAYAGEDTTICYGGSIQLNGQGSHTPSWDPSPFLSDPTIADPVVTQLTEESTFVLTITEKTSPFGCYDKDSVHVSLYPSIGIEVTPDTTVLSGSSTQLEVTGGPFSAYRWEPSTWMDNSTIPDPVVTPVDPIRYWVFATNEFGCEEVDSVFIDVIENLKVYNVFSPNNDGVNDYFEIDAAENFPDMRVEIYSRWGDLLYSTVGYDSGSRWDGTTRGTEAPVGTYYYIIIPYSGARPITGNVTIIR
jgi:gliding motility-associated-like protein